MHASTGNFVVKDSDMVLAVTSNEGILRLFDYAPTSKSNSSQAHSRD